MAYLINQAGTRVKPGDRVRQLSGTLSGCLVGYAQRPAVGQACRLVVTSDEGGTKVVYAHALGLRYVETLPSQVKANQADPAAALKLAGSRPDLTVQMLGAWYALLGADGAYRIKVRDRGTDSLPGWRYVAYPWGGGTLLARGDAMGTVALRGLAKLGA